MRGGGAGCFLHLAGTRKLRTETGASGPWVFPPKKLALGLCEDPFLPVARTATKLRV